MIRLFAHRGFCPENILQNSIASLNSAREHHFHAVEFDIWFLDEKLVLKHGEPKISEINTLPTFSDYLHYKNDLSYWLDFKNLNEKNAKAALLKVKEELAKFSIDLNQVYFAPFITNYKIAAKVFEIFREVFGEKIQLVAVCEDLEKLEILREFMTKNHVKFLSIFHKIIDQNFMKNFSDITVFAWTVNDLKSLYELERLGVKNFATDKITPQIYDKETRIFRT